MVIPRGRNWNTLQLSLEKMTAKLAELRLFDDYTLPMIDKQVATPIVALFYSAPAYNLPH